jgi:DnaA-homolog protein
MFLSSQLPLDFTIRNESTFDSFYVIQENSELINSLKKIEQQKEKFYFLWSEQTSGKSHLLQAICHNVEASVYIPLKKFSAYPPEILDGMELLSIVCIDDIEEVLGNIHWETKLFHLFNLIREQGHGLVIGSSTPPKGLKTELPDLDSRLKWGITYQLHGMDDKAKAEALRMRAELRGILLNNEILNYILLRSERDTRALFQVLDKLDDLSLTEKRKITIPFIKSTFNW